jgi:hypothetical protein
VHRHSGERIGEDSKYNSLFHVAFSCCTGGVMTFLSIARKSLVFIALVFAFNLGVPAGHAISAKSLEKQARKIESKLAKFPKGAFLHLRFRDGSESNGKLRNMSDNSFSFTNSESNTDETHSYSEVTTVEKGKVYIGKDSESRSRFRLPF